MGLLDSIKRAITGFAISKPVRYTPVSSGGGSSSGAGNGHSFGRRQ